jgi:death-on-curing protein
VLCWHLVKNHPLPDGNKRAGFIAVLEFAERNGRPWQRGAGDPAGTDAIIRGVADGSIDRDQLKAWIAERTQEQM